MPRGFWPSDPTPEELRTWRQSGMAFMGMGVLLLALFRSTASMRVEALSHAPMQRDLEALMMVLLLVGPGAALFMLGQPKRSDVVHWLVVLGGLATAWYLARMV